MASRDERGRFVAGNEAASLGGRARARKLSRRRRRQIARRGRAALVEKHFKGDDRAQRAYMAALGRWAYEQMAAVEGGLGGSVRRATRHPGTINDFLTGYWQLSLFDPLFAEVDFYSRGAP